MNHIQTTLALPRDTLLADELASEEMVEIVNLTSAQTGVPGTILISTAMGQEGPRVRYSAQPGLTQLGFIVSIADRPRVTAPATAAPPNANDLLKLAPQVVEWVLQNKCALLEFWQHGDTWSQPDVNEFIKRLHRVNMAEEDNFSDLHRKTVNNKDWLSISVTCGCYYCLKIFKFDRILNWIDDGNTATCPFCAVDSIIGFPADADNHHPLLKAMHDRWFRRSSYCFADDLDDPAAPSVASETRIRT